MAKKIKVFLFGYSYAELYIAVYGKQGFIEILIKEARDVILRLLNGAILYVGTADNG